MRNENDILKERTDAAEAYARLAADSTSPVGNVEAAAVKVSALTKELQEYVAQGADDCQCGNAPWGMLKTPAHMHMGVQMPNIWEVGCVHCAPVLVERPDGQEIDGKNVKRRSYSARGTSPQEAVEKWNNGDWVEDFYFDRMLIMTIG